MKRAAEKIHGLGARSVLVKGGHLTAELVDILYDGKDFHSFSAQRIDTGDTHGTGCTYSAAIATGLAGGLTLPEAVREAKEYITAAIRFSLRIGNGHGPVNHMAPVFEKAYASGQESKESDRKPIGRELSMA